MFQMNLSMSETPVACKKCHPGDSYAYSFNEDNKSLFMQLMLKYKDFERDEKMTSFLHG